MRDEKTINGQNWKQVMETLLEPFPAGVVQDRDGKPYIPANHFRERLDSVLAYNYRDTYTELEVINVKDSSIVKVKCEISILDDNGDAIFTKQCYGGANIIFPKSEDGKSYLTTCWDIPNSISSAEQDAFKRCCKRVGLGEREIKNAKKQLSGKLMNVTFTTSYRKSNSNIYASVEHDGVVYDFIYWNKDGFLNGFSDEELNKSLKKGNTIAGFFQEKVYNGKKQLILKNIPLPARFVALYDVEVNQHKKSTDGKSHFFAGKFEDSNICIVMFSDTLEKLHMIPENITVLRFYGEEHTDKKGDKYVVYIDEAR